MSNITTAGDGRYVGWCLRCGGDCFDGVRHRCPPPVKGAKILRAEIDGLRARNVELEAMVQAARAQLATAAAFLDRLAAYLETAPHMVIPERGAAADCRTKARELRGKQ